MRLDSSIVRRAASRSLQSAPMYVPGSRIIRSPGTRPRASIRILAPSRTTTPDGFISVLREEIVLSASLSVAKPIAELIATTLIIATASTIAPVRMEIPAAALSKATGKEFN